MRPARPAMTGRAERVRRPMDQLTDLVEGIAIEPTALLDIALTALLFYGLFSLIQGTRAVRLVIGAIVLYGVYAMAQAAGPAAAVGDPADGRGGRPAGPRGHLPARAAAGARAYRPGRLAGLGLRALGRRRPRGERGPDPVADRRPCCPATRTGALIVIERETGLEDAAETGVMLHADLSEELLASIFAPRTALHDGAVIVRAGRVLAAGAVLPLSEISLDRERTGTRHRAAIGITEQTDALVIVVSEETGSVSLVAARPHRRATWTRSGFGLRSWRCCGRPTTRAGGRRHLRPGRPVRARQAPEGPAQATRPASGRTPRRPAVAARADCHRDRRRRAGRCPQATPSAARRAMPSEAPARLRAAQLAAQAGGHRAGDGAVCGCQPVRQRADLARRGAHRGARPAGRAAVLDLPGSVTDIRYRAPIEAAAQLTNGSFLASIDLGDVTPTAGGPPVPVHGPGDRPRPPGPGHRLRAALGERARRPGRLATHDGHRRPGDGARRASPWARPS